jgi:chaperonin GroES
MKKVIPMGNRVLIKQDPKIETASNGLIYLPEAEQHQPPLGIVISAGPKCEQVKEGDYVQWPMEVNATAFMHNDEEHIVLGEGAIIAIIVDV